MYYYVEKETGIEKYLVNFQRQEAQELRMEIINKCSEIEHHEYDGTRIKMPDIDGVRIRNYKERYVGVKESKTLQYPNEDIFHYSYDEYKFPILISIMDGLLKGNIDYIDSFLKYNPKVDSSSIDDKIKRISTELDKVDDLNIYAKRKKLEELQKLVDIKKLNENQEAIDPYYNKLKELIKLELVDTMSKEEMERFNSFFETNSNLSKSASKIHRLK